MKSPRRAIAATIVLLAALSGASARQLTYVDILNQLTDLDRLAYWEEGIRAGQASSYDRGEHKRWGCNGDAGKYIRVEDSGEAVMAEIEGPGCIYRIWSANPQGRIRFYFDGADKPQVELDFNEMFTGNLPPFDKPLVYKRGGRRSASDCYLPIPFSRSVKITADRPHGQYYHFDYLQFPKDWKVQTFRLPLTEEERAALERAKAAWSNCGRDPKPTLPGQTAVKKSFTIAPGQTVVLAALKGPGIIRALRARVSSSQRYYWRKLLLRGVWDGADWPQVLTPLGPLFGFDWYTADYKSLVAGSDPQKGCYFYYPMPFRRSARLELTSYLVMPAQVEFEVEWAPVDAMPDNAMYFFARWRHEPRSSTFDYPFIETAGKGRFVGVTLQIDHPVPGWWGEGDEKVWVDDDQFPPWIGTGSEDYFGDAWGIRYLPGPSWGCSLHRGHRTCPYRWHFMDYIPFTKRLRMTIENYPSEVGGPRGAPPWEDDYSSVAFWYQRELVPPFDQLRGQKYVGALMPGQAPAQYQYRTDVFHEITGPHLRTFGRAIYGTLEAEAALADVVRAGKATIIHDALLPYEFNMEMAVDFGQVKAGEALATIELNVPETVVYYPLLYCAPEDGVADVGLTVAGKRLDVIGRPEKGVLELAGVVLTKGKVTTRLVALSAGRAVLDCIRLRRAQRAAGVIEAEDVPVVRVTGGADKPHPSPPIPEASAGRILEWHASKPGQGMVLRIDAKPDRPYVLGVRPMFGPGGGIIQAFVNGQPIGPQFDLFAARKHPSPRILPLGPWDPKTNEVEIRVVGKNEKAAAYHVGLDYFRFEPVIVGPDSAQGVWAEVLATKGCRYRIQNLGGPGQWYKQHHLWVQPSGRGAYVDIGLHIPREGDYQLIVRYTTSWDYAIVQAFLNGTALGGKVDCYTPDVRLMQPLPLGRVHLKAGVNVLRFQAVDKNEASRGYLMGIDYITVKPAG